MELSTTLIMYFLKIYNTDESEQLTKLKRFSSLQFEEVLNGFGTAEFKIDLNTVEANPTWFQNQNRVSIWRGATQKWRGYMLIPEQEGDNVTVELASLLKLLKKRHITKTYSSKSYAYIFQDILDTINATYATQFTYGGTDIGGGSEDMEFENTPAYDALKEVADAAAGEVYIDNDDAIWLKSQVGEDKTSTVTFRYLKNKMLSNNIKRPSYQLDGDNYHNYIIATNGDGLQATTDNVGAGEDRLEKRSVFSHITSLSALQDAADALGDKLLAPLSSLVVEPLATEEVGIGTVLLDESLYSVGDLCKIELSFGIVSLDTNYRVVKKTYNVMRDGNLARMTVELGNNPLTRDSFAKRFADMQRRLTDLEL